jgi:NifU-like protein involved in Fe-S cluster formation
MKKIVLILAVSLFSFSIMVAQSTPKYWVFFTDKKQTPYSIDKPLEFLSFKSIERRQQQHISIDETDLPVDPIYVQTIRNKGVFINNITKWANAITISTDDADILQAIKELPFVKEVKPVLTFIDPSRAANKEKFEPILGSDFPAFSTNKYGAALNQLKMIGIDTLQAIGYTGKGVDIGVFDGGFINVDKLNFFSIAHAENRIHPVWNYVDGNNNLYIRSFHGMNVLSVMCANVSGTMIGAAPDANYFLFITEDVNSETRIEEDNWAAAAEKADSMGIMIFSTSLGYTEFQDITTNHTYAEMNGDSTVITKAANMAARKGILVVNSAGNEGNSSWHYISAPADGDSVLCIGAVNENKVIASFSSRGPNSSGHLKPNVCGNGANIYVAVGDNDIQKGNGTSFSCPLIAAASACLWQAFPQKTNMEIFHAIEQSADRYNTPDDDYGFGIPNFFSAFKKYETDVHDNPLEVFPKVLPTIFDQSFAVLWHDEEAANVIFSLYDEKGAALTTQKVMMAKDTYEKVYFSELDGYHAGTYFLRITNGKKEWVFKLMKY